MLKNRRFSQMSRSTKIDTESEASAPYNVTRHNASCDYGYTPLTERVGDKQGRTTDRRSSSGQL